MYECIVSSIGIYDIGVHILCIDFQSESHSISDNKNADIGHDP